MDILKDLRKENVDKEYFKRIATILNQLEDKDQLELVKWFVMIYASGHPEDYDIEEVMHILNKLVFEEQFEIVTFFRDLYDPDIDVINIGG